MKQLGDIYFLVQVVLPQPKMSDELAQFSGNVSENRVATVRTVTTESTSFYFNQSLGTHLPKHASDSLRFNA